MTGLIAIGALALWIALTALATRVGTHRAYVHSKGMDAWRYDDHSYEYRDAPHAEDRLAGALFGLIWPISLPIVFGAWMHDKLVEGNKRAWELLKEQARLAEEAEKVERATERKRAKEAAKIIRELMKEGNVDQATED